MLTQNILHEIKLLSRNYWFVSLTVVITGLSIYAGHNGLKQFEKRQANLTEAIQNQLEKVERVDVIATALANGEEHPRAFRLSPMNYSIATGSLTIMPAEPLSKLVIGQSDLYTHQVNISSREDLATMSFNELNNPVQLLFGNFDLNFVLSYLIPLLIIAFTYNLKSQELETGRFRLLASNPINIKLWLLQRFIVRFLALVVVITVVLLVTMLSIGVKPDLNLLQFFGLTYAYMAFWFALTFLVNVFGFSSAKNAVSLLSLWILLVLIVPTVINQMANTIYPMPSRVALLNEIRSTKKQLGKEQDKVLDEYLRNHPELIRNEGENAYGYWQGFYASQEITEKTLNPLISAFDKQLNQQQNWVNTWGLLSPAVIFQNGTTRLAGTSAAHYKEFQNQTKTFNIEWRDHFLPFVFKNKMLVKSDLEVLPDFEFDKGVVESSAASGVIILFLFTLILSMIGLLYKKSEQSVSIN
ncbi:DUF3526 domain-containing protein [Roseivirga misakiensis]|uniref:ABC transporter permease n=1 Tax=Roseivirga misakiensis TaxID=1563681 RepID=A0A1E5SY23_9BACT|nr:DUF3526 domain-containing protein [Roseivirga misakiensis]OEK04016.1 hypothetical protein BFP71_11000 [Roseivirga misakiensis]